MSPRSKNSGGYCLSLSVVLGFQFQLSQSLMTSWSAGMDQQLVATIKRRLEGMIRVSKEAQKRRLIAWMQRRGHSWEVILAVMKEVGLTT